MIFSSFNKGVILCSTALALVTDKRYESSFANGLAVQRWAADSADFLFLCSLPVRFQDPANDFGRARNFNVCVGKLTTAECISN